jgi:hypothetical protein
MVGYIRDSFCDEPRYIPRFGPISSASRWYQNAERINPEPTDLKAFRDVHPDFRHPGMPDFLSIGWIPVVSEPFRQIILALESDRHQFLPIALYDEARQPLPGTYWVVNVLQRPDCVIESEQIRKWDAEGHALPELEGFWVPTSIDPRRREKVRQFRYIAA